MLKEVPRQACLLQYGILAAGNQREQEAINPVLAGKKRRHKPFILLLFRHGHHY